MLKENLLEVRSAAGAAQDIELVTGGRARHEGEIHETDS